MQKFSIVSLSNSSYQELIEIWEASVRATHFFLEDDFIPMYKPLILAEYFDSVQLFGLMDELGKIHAFSGIDVQKLEMLFVDPNCFGMGYGKAMLEHAIREMNVIKVDVNEQNEQAVQFYLSQGFRMESRSEQDEQGNPYPILHLRLNYP
jgi:putative acetyltransferase